MKALIYYEQYTKVLGKVVNIITKIGKMEIRNMFTLIKYTKPVIPIFTFTILSILIIQAYNQPLFDEVWYVPAAKTFLSSRKYERLEHPPLGQLLISSGIFFLGDNPIGWRFLSLIFGASSLFMIYLISLKLTKNELTAFTSLILLSIDKMFFTFSNLGVLDIFFIFFSLLSIYMALKRCVLISAFAMAAGLCCKLTAVIMAPVILVIIFKVGEFSTSKRHSIINVGLWLTYSTIFFLILLYALNNLYSSVGVEHILRSPINHIFYMIGVHASSNWPIGYGEPPWNWLIRPQNYYISGMSLINIGFLETFNPIIYGLTFLSIPNAIFKSLKLKDFSAIITSIWFIFSYIVWIPIYFLISRPIFSFYLLSTIPIICITVAAFVDGEKKLQYSFITVNVILFLFFQYPINIILL